MDVTGNLVVKILKTRTLKEAFIGLHITGISLENVFHRIQNPACELN